MIINRFLWNFWRAITQPSPAVRDAAARRRAELLAALTFILAALNVIGLFFSLRFGNIMGILVLAALSVVLTTAYILSRTRYYRIGIGLDLTTWTAVTFGYALSGQTTNGPLFTYATFIPLIFALGAAWLSLRGLTILVTVNLGGVLLSPLIDPAMVGHSFNLVAGVLTCLAGLLLVTQKYRDLVERERSANLRQAAEEVRQLNAELEQRVARRTAELEAANTELESFSYSVSHDLRAPLRAVDGFARLLAQQYAEQLDADGARYLYRVRDAAEQMGQLIDDLLAFSRLGRKALHLQPLSANDLETMLNAVVDELRLESADRLVEVVVGDLPPCAADPALLRQVWTNLIRNAWKYTRPRAVARIEIGSLKTYAGLAYYVRDNGVGFDMQYSDKLFGVFQRLHRAEEFEGTGVGLANVHRIVQRHGGQVWAEAVIDQGTTFYFTLGAPVGEAQSGQK